jgi:sugar phosphate isomerase/epimerase
MDRRQFLGKSAAGVASAVLLTHLPANLFAGEKMITPYRTFGFQSYVWADALQVDFPGTLKKVQSMGYSQIEMCSPKSYQWKSIARLSNKEINTIINDAGLTCPSCHFKFGELKDELDDRIEFAQELGLKDMILQGFFLEKNATLNDYRKAADKLNEIAQKINKTGIQAGYHNHNMEFEKINGALIYDILMEQFDPKLVKMQFQVAVISEGYKASDYFRKYPGRFISAHLSDWSATSKKGVPIGQGVVDWEEFFKTAEASGVKYFFVENDIEFFKEDISYLKSL